MRDWILKFIKGMFIGTGFILPGVSGGALAAIFGIYERIISFLAHITQNFKKNVLFFIPIGLGGVTGVFLLSFAISYFLGAFETQILWFFLGCILGTLPSLWKLARKKGYAKRHYMILGISFVLSLLFLLFGQSMITGGLVQNFGTWMLAGALIGLGLVVPGLSSSTFLVYLDMYKPMTDGIKSLDFMVIIPIILGGLLCVIALSKLVDYILSRAYTTMFHIILGVVFASTVMIIPRDYNYLSSGAIICFLLCAAGVAFGLWMSRLEVKYKLKS